MFDRGLFLSLRGIRRQLAAMPHLSLFGSNDPPFHQNRIPRRKALDGRPVEQGVDGKIPTHSQS
jgi:hypothetical protein